jgi:hypothetical protein
MRHPLTIPIPSSCNEYDSRSVWRIAVRHASERRPAGRPRFWTKLKRFGAEYATFRDAALVAAQ